MEKTVCDRDADCVVRDESVNILTRDHVSVFLASSFINKNNTLGMGMISDVYISNCVRETGKFNFCGAQIVISSNWNHELLDALCTSASDKEVASFLKYGWPINRQDAPLTKTYTNHSTAVQFQQAISSYIKTELKHGTLMGPFVTSPFPIEITGYPHYLHDRSRTQ